jgi:hypothetical protein
MKSLSEAKTRSTRAATIAPLTRLSWLEENMPSILRSNESAR